MIKMYYSLYLDLQYGILPSFNYNIIQTITKDKILLRSSSNCITDFSQDHERYFILADSDDAIAGWSTENVPVIAWSHSENQKESLMGARFMILSPDALTKEYLEEIHCRFYGIPVKILETERCYLRELTMDDLENVKSLDAEQATDSHGRFFRGIMNCDDKEPQSQEENSCTSYLRTYIQTQYPFYGYGIYAAYLKNENTFLGVMGFADTEDGEIEFGYAVKREFQRQGYAKEWGKSLILYAKEQWDFHDIVARISPDNIPSIRTAKACGVKILHDFSKHIIQA